MKFKVDQDLCIGCEMCVGICPKVFEMSGDKAQVILAPVPEDAQTDALSAEESCPVGAIIHSED